VIAARKAGGSRIGRPWRRRGNLTVAGDQQGVAALHVLRGRIGCGRPISFTRVLDDEHVVQPRGAR